MYHTLYKTTNSINGKIYIGVHTTENLNDKYIGSGIGISRAIDKYGHEAFSKEILMLCESQEEAYSIEKILVCGNFIKRKDVYNTKVGGKGNTKGYSYFYDDAGNQYYMRTEDAKSRTDLYGRKHTEEDKMRMKSVRRKFLDQLSPEEFKNLYCGKVCSEITRQKIAAKQKGVAHRKLSHEEKQAKSIKSKSVWANFTEEERKLKCKTKTAESEELRREKIAASSRKPKDRIMCPHCHKTGGAGAMKRYHFDNCKFKEQ
jgi:hypothetical protein